MSWKNLTIGKKIILGFLSLLILLVVVAGVGYFGVLGMIGDSEEVVKGNELNALLIQREVDHLKWTNIVGATLLNDQASVVNVQADDHKCGFGKWLYGEGRKEGG